MQANMLSRAFGIAGALRFLCAAIVVTRSASDILVELLVDGASASASVSWPYLNASSEFSLRARVAGNASALRLPLPELRRIVEGTGSGLLLGAANGSLVTPNEAVYKLAFSDAEDTGSAGGSFSLFFDAGLFKDALGNESRPTAIQFYIGFGVTLEVIDAHGYDVSVEWLHPANLARIRAKGRFSCAELIEAEAAAIAAGRGEGGAFSSFVSVTPSGALVVARLASCVEASWRAHEPGAAPPGSRGVSTALFSVVSCLSADEAIRDPRQAVLMPGSYGLQATAGSLGNGVAGSGLSASRATRNVASMPIRLRIGWAPVLSVLDGNEKDVSVAFDASLAWPLSAPVPTFSRDLRVAVDFAELYDFSAAELDAGAANVSAVLMWPDGLTPPTSRPIQQRVGRRLVYLVNGRTQGAGTFDIGLRQGSLPDRSGLGVYNAAARARIVLDAQLQLRSWDGSGPLISWPFGSSQLSSKAELVRLALSGAVPDATVALASVLSDIVDSRSKSVRTLVLGGQVGAAVAPISASLEGGIEWPLDLSRLPAGRYSSALNSSAPLVDVAGSPFFMAQSFTLEIISQPPKAMPCSAEIVIFIGSAAETAFPIGLFDTDPADLAVLRIASFDRHNLQASRAAIFESATGAPPPPHGAVATLAEAVLRPALPLGVAVGPSGQEFFTLVVSDKAGNVANTTVLVNFILQDRPSLVVYDARGVSGSSDEGSLRLFTGGGHVFSGGPSSSCELDQPSKSPRLYTCTVVLRAEATFATEAIGLAADSLLLKPHFPPPPWSDEAWGEQNWSPTGWISPPWRIVNHSVESLLGPRTRAKWTIEASRMSTGATFTLQLPGGAALSNGRHATNSSNAVEVVFDLVPPGGE